MLSHAMELLKLKRDNAQKTSDAIIVIRLQLSGREFKDEGVPGSEELSDDKQYILDWPGLYKEFTFEEIV